MCFEEYPQPKLFMPFFTFLWLQESNVKGCSYWSWSLPGWAFRLHAYGHECLWAGGRQIHWWTTSFSCLLLRSFSIQSFFCKFSVLLLRSTLVFRIICFWELWWWAWTRHLVLETLLTFLMSFLHQVLPIIPHSVVLLKVKSQSYIQFVWTLSLQSWVSPF